MGENKSSSTSNADSGDRPHAFLTVDEVAHQAAAPLRTIQHRLQKAIAAHPDRGSVFKPARGRTRARYRADFIADFFEQHRFEPFTRALKSIPIDRSGIRVISGRDDGDAGYNMLLLTAIKHARTLHLRGIAGSIFDHGAAATALASRRQATKILLLNPFCEAARDRAAAAEAWFAARRDDAAAYRETKLWNRGVREALAFLRNNPHLEARWVDEVPYTFLVWTEDLAIVEAYDYGREDLTMADGIPSSTLSGKAPLLIVPRQSGYHVRLRDGFERVFNGCVDHLPTRSLADIEAALKKDRQGTLGRAHQTRSAGRSSRGIKDDR